MVDIIIHYSGSFLGLFIMVLMYNFLKERKKLDLKSYILIFIISGISLVNTLLNYTISKVLIFYLLYILTLKIIFKDNIKEITVKALINYLIVMFFEIFCSLFMIILPFSNALDIDNSPINKFIISTLIMLISYLVLYIRKFNKFIKRVSETLINKNAFHIIVAVVMILIFLSTITFKNALNFHSLTHLIINIVLFVIIIFAYTISVINMYKRNKAEEKEEILLTFIKKYEFIVDKDRINRHEMLNNLLVLKSFENKSSKEYLTLIDNFIKEYKSTTSNILKNLHKLPSGLKGIIYYKLYDMEKEGIKTFIKISSKSVSKLDKMEVNIYSKICKIVGILFKNGGKQYKVSEGSIVLLDKLSLEPKSKVEFSEVLALHDGANLSVGTPFVSGAKIEAEVINEGRGKKVITFKKRRRKDSKTKRGFRRDFTRVRILKITK